MRLKLADLPQLLLDRVVDGTHKSGQRAQSYLAYTAFNFGANMSTVDSRGH